MATLVRPKEPSLGFSRRFSRHKRHRSRPRFTGSLGVVDHPPSKRQRGLALGEELFFAVVSHILAESLKVQRPDSSWVWDSPRVKAILEQPEAAPIDISKLTEEEIDALAREAKGMWADHPYIKDSVEWVRELRKGLYRGVPEE